MVKNARFSAFFLAFAELAIVALPTMTLAKQPDLMVFKMVSQAAANTVPKMAAKTVSPLTGPNLTAKVADEAMARWPDGASKAWDFQLGAEMAGMDAAWRSTHDQRYFQYIQHVIDRFVQPDGTILTYKVEEYTLNDMLLGRELLMLYQATQDETYRKAAAALRRQLAGQPATPSGGFWHTQATPNLMLLDDQFMLDPFYAEYARTFHEPQDFVQITKQFVLLDEYTRDAKSGLLFHGWQETGHAPWGAGTSPNLWARGMGWYMMALVDTLPYYAPADPQRKTVLDILQRTAAALVKHQDGKSGLWYQILDRPAEQGNYIESSSVLMFTYALAKGARLGYLPTRDHAAAERAWKGIRERFVTTAPDGNVSVTGTVTGIALGAAPANDGSDAYYLKAPVVSDDPKGIGPFLLAASELER